MRKLVYFIIGLIVLPIIALAATTTKNLPIQVTQAICSGCNSQPSITSLSLGSPSFTGGAADGTTVSAITVTTSNGSTPTLALTGTQTGTGNDKDSFRISGTNLLTNTAGGATDQPGQYSICVTATGSYTNSPQQACGTVQATGTGGAGWQLTFSDEFACPNSMLECLSTVSASSYTWSSGFCSGLISPSAKGCGSLTVASLPTGISSANCSGSKLGACQVSIAGATNAGSAGDAAVNGTFLVVDAPTSTTLTLYMPYAGVNATMGGTITVGSGPWVTALASTCVSGACTGLPLLGSNDNGGEAEGWDPHACAVVSNIFKINVTTSGSRYLNASGSTTANYIPPSSMQPGGIAYSVTTCHIQSWNGSSGNGQGQELYIDYYVKTPAGSPHTSLWSLSETNDWNQGPELDIPECFSTNGCNWSIFSGSSFQQGLTNQDYTAAFHQFGSDITNTDVTFFLDTVSSFSHSQSNPTNTIWYPIVDVTVDSAGPTPTDNSSLSAHYVRVYGHVGSGACYSSIPSTSTVPHTGTC